MNDLAGRVLKLAGLLDYQEGAVVSRTIIDKRTGTVTLFAFDEGEGLSEHTAPFDVLVYVLDGEAAITVSGKESRVTAGEMLIMPANQPHALRAVKRFKMLLVMVREGARVYAKSRPWAASISSSSGSITSRSPTRGWFNRASFARRLSRWTAASTVSVS